MLAPTPRILALSPPAAVRAPRISVAKRIVGAQPGTSDCAGTEKENATCQFDDDYKSGEGTTPNVEGDEDDFSQLTPDELIKKFKGTDDKEFGHWTLPNINEPAVTTDTHELFES